jgi:hypothetical protein
MIISLQIYSTGKSKVANIERTSKHALDYGGKSRDSCFALCLHISTTTLFQHFRRTLCCTKAMCSAARHGSRAAAVHSRSEIGVVNRAWRVGRYDNLTTSVADASMQGSLLACSVAKTTSSDDRLLTPHTYTNRTPQHQPPSRHSQLVYTTIVPPPAFAHRSSCLSHQLPSSHHAKAASLVTQSSSR